MELSASFFGLAALRNFTCNNWRASQETQEMGLGKKGIHRGNPGLAVTFMWEEVAHCWIRVDCHVSTGMP